MMVLLPLRGWAGDFMSVQMAAGQAAAQAAAGMHKPQATPAMAPGCPMHSQAATHSSEASDDTAQVTIQHTTNCTSCDLCTPMAELLGAVHQVLVRCTDAQPRMHPASFVSAALAQAVKPPIF